MTFDEFWQLYPRKVGKLQAAREWRRVLQSPEVCRQIVATLAWQTPLWAERDATYTPHPATWLHQGRWLDEPPAPVAQPAAKAVQGIAAWVAHHKAG